MRSRAALKEMLYTSTFPTSKLLRFGTELPFFYCSLLLFRSCYPLIRKIDVTAAVGLCLEKISKEELDKTKDVLRLILPGVSCKLLFLCFWWFHTMLLGVFSLYLFFGGVVNRQAGKPYSFSSENG